MSTTNGDVIKHIDDDSKTETNQCVHCLHTFYDGLIGKHTNIWQRIKLRRETTISSYLCGSFGCKNIAPTQWHTHTFPLCLDCSLSTLQEIGFMHHFLFLYLLYVFININNLVCVSIASLFFNKLISYFHTFKISTLFNHFFFTAKLYYC